MSELYAITDLEGYALQMRAAAANSLSENCEDNLDEFISVNQLINLVKSECLGFDDENRPLLDENSNEKIFEDIAIWIHGVALAKLAAKDLIQCAWDDDSSEMVFWKSESEDVRTKNTPRKNKKTKGSDSGL